MGVQYDLRAEETVLPTSNGAALFKGSRNSAPLLRAQETLMHCLRAQETVLHYLRAQETVLPSNKVGRTVHRLFWLFWRPLLTRRAFFRGPLSSTGMPCTACCTCL
jgi:hypothetical protein